MTLPRLAYSKTGPSGGACAALALSLMLGCSLVSGTVAVTGCIDLRGAINVVGGIEEKIRQSKEVGIGLVIVPMGNLMQLDQEGWDDELKEYVSESVRGASSFVDVMELAVEGEY